MVWQKNNEMIIKIVKTDGNFDIVLMGFNFPVGWKIRPENLLAEVFNLLQNIYRACILTR